MKHKSNFNHGFTNRGCLHCAIIKALYGFNEKRAHMGRDMQFFLQNFKIRFSRVWKYLKTTWNLLEQSIELT